MNALQSRTRPASPLTDGQRRSAGSPSRAGYWWGALLIALGAVIGGGLLALGIGSAIHSLPRLSAEFDSSASAATTRVTAPAHWALYVRSHELPAGTCTVRADSGTATTSPASTSMNFTHDAGSWTWVANVDGSRSGTYAVTCPPGHYAIGEQPQIAGFAVRVAGAVLGLVAPLVLGIAAGGAVIVATARRAGAGRAIAD
jgi:hypothetical protein